MLVSELIQILKDMPQDAHVLGWSEGAARVSPDAVFVERLRPYGRSVVLINKDDVDAAMTAGEIDTSYPILPIDDYGR